MMQLLEKYSKEVEVLKEEVKDMLIAVKGKPAEKMVLIDALERLGVSYLFEKEIEELLEHMFSNFEEYSRVFEDNLFMVSLHFRVFRQHGYSLSSGVFEKFKDCNGEFKETLSKDVMGMLSLYEATYLKTHGEDILDQALCFTKAGLESLKPHLSPNLAKQVAHAQYQPVQRSIPRVEARHYISVYENDASRNEKLLRLAKIDFNLLQMLHKKELCHISGWWKDLDLVSEAPYVRDRAVECFFTSASAYFEPQYSLARLILTKATLIISILDDTYDAYGTYEELKLFTNAVHRWDINAMDQLPKYMKSVYKALLNLHDEIEREMAKHERTYAVHYLKEAFKEIISCYRREMELLKKGHVQSFDEYLIDALITVAIPLLTTASFLGMTEIATTDAFQWLQTKPRSLTALSTLCRLLNDIQTSKAEELKVHHMATGVECYMKQHGVSKSEAVDEFYERIENAWKDINEEMMMMRPAAISNDLLMRILNYARLHDVGYKNDDGYTQAECVKDHVIALFVDPIPV
ncbi:valerianol synthase TPS8-like [Rhododendron vialii]|uniref:valerianol synthase TPS8-like n=1 Tax=Rhododendron vialii TaxID=182163 RepID=UPI00265FBDC9|nr:valerianol synthase TPS8-like [Rhododendron vialii]